MKRSSKAKRRTGTAMVEFAIVAPLLFLLFFAAVEFCRVAMIRHTADNAVYESCRVGIIPGATGDEVQTEASRILTTIGVNNFDIQVTPFVIDRETEEVTVRIDVPIDGNSYVPTGYFDGITIVRELTMRREGIRRP